jgi:hypothetical protein
MRNDPKSDLDPLSRALVEHLSLDPAQITGTGLRAEFNGTGPIVVRWDGVAYLSVEEFQQLVSESGTKLVPE